MTKTSTQIMWGYQRPFRIWMQGRAEELFGNLDDRLNPTLFLVGMRDESNNTSRFTTCVESEDEFWVHSRDFNDVREISRKLVGQYPESQMRHSHPLAQEGENRALQGRSIRDAIKKIVDAHQKRPVNRRFFVTYPAQVGNFLVCAVLSLKDDIVRSYSELVRNTVPIHEHRTYTVPVSFLDAFAQQFLRQLEEELQKPEPSPPDSINGEELLRRAGDKMAQGVVWRLSEEPFTHGHDLFRKCSTISSLHYERSTGSGRILLASRNHHAIRRVVTFETPIKLSNYRAARKILELAFDDISLHCDSNLIYGIARIDSYDSSKEDLFEVRIIDDHYWELRHKGCALMTVRHGLPSLPKLEFDEKRFRGKVKQVFEGVSDLATELLLSLVKEAREESHGTLLVISTAAADEARRLASQGTPITPCQLTPELLRHLTPIDGALILDPSGRCHAVGAILDGQASMNGDPGRGARYNSAIRYVEYSSGEVGCLAAVVSEDGGVDFVPSL